VRIIIDNNILFSLLKEDSSASKIIDITNIEMYAPDFIISEFEEHRNECMKKSGLKEEDFKNRLKGIIQRVVIVKSSEYKNQIQNAFTIISDKDDAPYIALGLTLKIPIWSNDPDLKEQSIVEVCTTKELLNKLLE